MLNLDRELDIVFSHIDDLYWAEKRSIIDLILNQVDEKWPIALLIAFLSTTIPHKEEFIYRKRIINIIKIREPDRPGLWWGLE